MEIDANPKPQLEWAVRDQRIKEGTIDSTGRIEAEIAQDQVTLYFRFFSSFLKDLMSPLCSVLKGKWGKCGGKRKYRGTTLNSFN